MLAQQHPNRTIFYRVCPKDKEDVLQISRGLLNRDFVHYMDQSKFVFLLRKTSLDSFWKKRRVLGFMLAEKLDHNIAEIIRWSFSDPYYIDLMMLIVMIEELYAEGIETIKWSKKNLCGANKEHVLRILNELGFLKSFPIPITYLHANISSLLTSIHVHSNFFLIRTLVASFYKSFLFHWN